MYKKTNSKHFRILLKNLGEFIMKAYKKIKQPICMLLAVLLSSAVFTGCGNDGGEWVTSEIVTYEDVKSDSQSGGGSKENSETGTAAKDKNSSPDKLKNANITVFWPKTTDDHPEFTSVVSAFEKKYGGKVNIVGTGKYDDRASRLTNLVQSKTQVDVVFTSAEDYPSYALTSLVRPIDTNQFDFTKAPYKINNENSYTKLNGQTYFVKTTDTSGGVLMLYNKTLFENAGMKTPLELYKAGNWNWNTFREAARKLSEDTNSDGKNDIYGWADYSIDALLASNGTTLLTYDGKNFASNSNEAVSQAYQLYYDMYNIDNSICKDPWSWSTDMVQGKLAMVCQKADQILYWKSQGAKYEYDFAPLPKGQSADKYFSAVTFNNCFSMGATCKNPEGAYAFMKFYVEQTDGKRYNEKTGSAKFTSDQEKRLDEYAKLSSITYSPVGFGNLKTDARSLLWAVRGGQSAGTALAYWKDILNQDINIAMMAGSK